MTKAEKRKVMRPRKAKFSAVWLRNRGSWINYYECAEQFFAAGWRAALSALAEKEREVEWITTLHKGLMAEADKRLEAAEARAAEMFDGYNKMMVAANKAEARAGETDRLLREVRGRWQWKGPSREENFEIMLREIDRTLAAWSASPAGRKE